MRLKIYSDGGARGNPGPAAAAFLIISENGQILASNAFFLGDRTNNQAEYEALIAALEAAVAVGGQEIICHLDSQLVGKQMSGEFRVKNVELHKLWIKARHLMRGFKLVSFVNVPRTNAFIKKVDRMLNLKLDEASKSSG